MFSLLSVSWGRVLIYQFFPSLFQVNNLALLASLTLQKVLNINNNNNQHSKNNNHSDNSNSKQHEQQKQQQQPQRRNLDIKSEYDVLNQLLKTGAVFTATPTAPIAIERRKQTQQQQRPYAQQAHQQQQQKQRLNSSISSTHSSTSTNSSYGSSSSEDAAGISAPTGAGAVVTSAALTPRASTTKASSNKLPEKSKIPSDILDDLASRFIINVPDMELNNLIRMCFQIELAHWFYLDFFCAPESGEDGETPKCVQRKLPSVGIKQFAMQLFQVSFGFW